MTQAPSVSTGHSRPSFLEQDPSAIPAAYLLATSRQGPWQCPYRLDVQLDLQASIVRFWFFLARCRLGAPSERHSMAQVALQGHRAATAAGCAAPPSAEGCSSVPLCSSASAFLALLAFSACSEHAALAALHRSSPCGLSCLWRALCARAAGLKAEGEGGGELIADPHSTTSSDGLPAPSLCALPRGCDGESCALCTLLGDLTALTTVFSFLFGFWRFCQVGNTWRRHKN